MTVADRLRAEGRLEERAAAILELIRQRLGGPSAALADAILELIRQRLGEPSAALAARVVAGAGEGVGPWFERILAASDLVDLEARRSD